MGTILVGKVHDRKKLFSIHILIETFNIVDLSMCK